MWVPESENSLLDIEPSFRQEDDTMVRLGEGKTEATHYDY